MTGLHAILQTAHPKILLYCRTGNRALRTYALVLASTPGGLDLEHILRMARRLDRSIEELRAEIARRIAARPASAGARP